MQFRVQIACDLWSFVQTGSHWIQATLEIKWLLLNCCSSNMTHHAVIRLMGSQDVPDGSSDGYHSSHGGPRAKS